MKNEIASRNYEVWKSIYFIVTEPKPREVFAADFRDRVIHHFFIRSIEKNFYNALSDAISSCIRDRWTLRAIKQLQKNLDDYNYYLQIDIKSFFSTIDKNILFEKSKNFFTKKYKRSCKW